MKKKVLIICGLMTLLVAFLCVVAMLDTKPQKEYISASWSYGYADVEELTEHSDLIALVKVNGLIKTLDKSVPASVYSVTVTDPILGCEKDEEISIYMTGGEIDGQIFEVDTDPLMEKNQEFMIFARKNEDGTHTILGGPQGRLLYEDGVLNSLKNTSLPYANTKNGKTVYDATVNVKDEDLEEIKARINSALQ